MRRTLSVAFLFLVWLAVTGYNWGTGVSNAIGGEGCASFIKDAAGLMLERYREGAARGDAVGSAGGQD